MDLGELNADEKFKSSVENLDAVLDRIDESITDATQFKDLEDLSASERVNLLNYLAYSTNSLYWIYLKLNGADVNEHGIKNELSRVRQTILREKQIIDHKTIRPQLNKNVANRFIKHELKIPRDKQNNEVEK